MNSKRKYPLPRKYEVTFSLISGTQFLMTQFSVDFGDGHSPVNWSMRARSTNDRTTWIGVSGGREITRISSSFLINFAASAVFFFGRLAKS